LSLTTIHEALQRHRGAVGTVIGVVATLLLGPGSFWEWRRARTEELTQRLALSEQSLKLREKIDESFEEAVHIQFLRARLRECDPEGKNHRVQNKLAALEKQIELHVADFTALETQLASLERRQPRVFMPPALAIVLRSVEIIIDSQILITKTGRRVRLKPPFKSPPMESLAARHGWDTLLPPKCPALE
jgi:hypothetical protein